nr:hypothetical protein GCM10025699_00150 [Microbacterium flavescens]BFF12486.1 hypothetical protein GCM10025699_37890 [Microbacterium flavescens]
MLAISGEAGVGKTALLDDAVSRLTEARLLRAIGHESEREVPYAGLLQLLRPALGVLDGIPHDRPTRWPVRSPSRAGPGAINAATPATGSRWEPPC